MKNIKSYRINKRLYKQIINKIIKIEIIITIRQKIFKIIKIVRLIMLKNKQIKLQYLQKKKKILIKKTMSKLLIKNQSKLILNY